MKAMNSRSLRTLACRADKSISISQITNIPVRNTRAAACIRPSSQFSSRKRFFGTTAPRNATGKEVKFTTENYPNIQRDSRFSEVVSLYNAYVIYAPLHTRTGLLTLTREDVDHFKQILGSTSSVIDAQDDASEVDGFNTDWMRKYRGQSKLVLKPKTAEEVSEILKYCTKRKLAVVPQGGNTGLVGGSVPVFDEIVISLAGMNKIRDFNEVSGVLVADAGVILENADTYLRERNHLFPLDLGAKGSCFIGGNVATNAGGLRLLRYGSLHGSVLGIEAVLPDGTIFRDLQKLRKNNTGFDLKQMFIGSEGTLGIITGISILCPQRSLAVNTAYFGLENFDKVKQAFVKAKKDLGEILSAFELMDGISQDMVHETTGKTYPLDGRHPFHILIETSGSNGEHDSEKLEKFLEEVMSEDIVGDGVLAQDETQAKTLWTWREGLPEACAHFGGTYKYDVSIPLDEFYTLVEDCRQRLGEAGLISKDYKDDSKPVVNVVGWGHMGDSNLHLNVAVRRYDKEVEKLMEPWVYEWIQKRNGSISAEHGLGLQKRNYVQYSRDPTSLELMKRLKKTFDPLGIMNPYKYIPF